MKRIVFVTGAGASAPYGFPLGLQLAGDIIGWLRQHHAIELLKPFGVERDRMLSFAEALQQSGRQSVDAFLEHRPEYIQIGKLAIANSLIQREQLPALFGRNDSWLDYLFNRITCPFEKFGANGIAFITFNYDRSLEQYLYTCLRNSYGKSVEECAEQLENIPVVHLHGDLGVLPWQHWKRGPVRDYVPTISTEALHAAADRIKIIHEDITGRDEEFAQAKALLKHAERIYFLGFGYNTTNMTRLGVTTISATAEGTGFGLTDHERGQIKAVVGHKVGISQFDCIGFFRHVVRW